MFAVLLSIIVHFIAIRLVISTMHQHTEILLKSMQMFLRYDFFSIFWMAIGNHVELINGKILFEEGVWRTEACHHTKFCRNWSIHRGDIATFRYLKMAATAILNFQIREILLADGSRGPTRITVPLCRRQLAFLNSWNFITWLGPRSPRRIILPLILKIGQSVTELLRFFEFLKMAAVRHLVFVWGMNVSVSGAFQSRI